MLWTFFAIAAFYIGTIGALPLLGKDEPRYVEIARNMMERGDWVTPMLGGHTWFEKPSLLYWMVSASFKIFGVSEWAAHLGPALCGLAIIGLVFWISRRVEKESAAKIEDGTRGLALWCALAMASCVGLIAFAHGATFDIVLTATISLSLACFFAAELENTTQKRRLLLAGFWAGLGLSLLAKGLVGIILPGGVVFIYFGLRRDWRGVGRLGVLWGLPLALVVASLWYGPVIARHGQVFINEFFVQQHFARYLSNKYRHAQPVYYYLPVMALFALPWTAFLLSALREIKVSMWRDDDAQSKLSVFALAWLLAPIAFFSLSGSKLPGYILPSLPAAMLLVGMSLTTYVRGENLVGCARITGVLLLILSSVAAIYAHRSGAINWLNAGIVALPLCGAGVIAIMMAHRRALCAGLVVGAMLLSTGFLTAFVGIPLAEKASVRSLIHIANIRGFSRTPVWQMQTMQRSSEFYAAGRLTYDLQGEPKMFDNVEEIALDLSPNGEVLVLMPLPQAGQLKQSPLLQSELLGDNGAVALLVVRLKNSVRARG